jgi:hypothetical protein
MAQDSELTRQLRSLESWRFSPNQLNSLLRASEKQDRDLRTVTRSQMGKDRDVHDRTYLLKVFIGDNRS